LTKINILYTFIKFAYLNIYLLKAFKLDDNFKSFVNQYPKVMVKESMNKKTNLENISFDFEFNNNYITLSKKLLVLIT